MNSGNRVVDMFEEDERRSERQELCDCGYNDTYTVLMCHGSAEPCEEKCEYWHDTLSWWQKMVAKFKAPTVHPKCDMAHEEEYCVNCDSKIVY